MTGNAAAAAGPVVVTGLPRSGTSWVGKMLVASGELVYVNEPMNPSRPPGRSPGVLDADVAHYFHYIGADADGRWLEAFRRTAALRYGLVRELSRNRAAPDLVRAGKNAVAFSLGRLRGRRALLDDPYALTSVGWLVDNLAARGVVLVRDPVALAASWRRLDWHVDPDELLAQDELMADRLGSFANDLGAFSGERGRADRIGSVATLWRATTSLAIDLVAERPSLVLRRYESLARDPVEQFAELYGHLGLTWDQRSQVVVTRATTGTSARGDRRAGFAWSVRGGLSRTAYRPMDSRGAVDTAAAGLAREEVSRIRELTADVAARLDAA